MEITLRHLGPGDRAWLVHQHGERYAQDEGFDETFGPLVDSILADFEADHDPLCERAFIAWQGDQRLGSIFCVRLDETTAKLRLFFLTPEARGKGLGKRLLTECMDFARAVGYTKMVLWTHESHRAACALYQKAGWRLLRSKPVRSFGVDLVEQSWEVDL
ncbi:GNAT family N-acetyltransferase [Primorskyibacter sp. 2E233]|uniref:GNAT family N-acetyltransferase n=1 Tax=Primorskyibacter sp. 2E233 TaxID=3413431 RepID=UPI003BF413AD